MMRRCITCLCVALLVAIGFGEALAQCIRWETQCSKVCEARDENGKCTQWGETCIEVCVEYKDIDDPYDVKKSHDEYHPPATE